MFSPKHPPCSAAAATAGARAGFALVMLAAFVLVLGLVTAVMVTGSKRDAYWKPQTGTTESLQELSKHLIKYQRVNYSLPCPAPMNALPSATTYGDDTDCTTTPAASGTSRVEIPPAGSGRFMRIGALPYKTLGLTENYALDGHGNRLYYAVMEEVTDNMRFKSATGAITVKDGAGDNLATNAAYIVFSTGADGKGATASTGTASAIACPSDNSAGADFENCDGDTVFVQGNSQTATPGSSYFDDQLLWARVDAVAQQSAPVPNLYCWGVNGNGQLGDGTTIRRLTPTPVRLPLGGTIFSKLAVGGSYHYHNCGIGNNGITYCWGGNSWGQLGDGTTTTQTTPTPVTLPAGVSSFTSVALGEMHSCGMGSDGNAYCWGNNSVGQLGDGTTTQRRTPTQVTLPTGVTSFTSVVAGREHSCGMGNNGLAYCWGRNMSGELGNDSNVNSLVPVRVKDPVDAPTGFAFTSLEMGAYHSCGMGNNGKAYCWGRNTTYQLGNDSVSNVDSLVPVRVKDPVDAPAGFALTSLAVAWDHSCGMGSNGRIYCWGRGYWGQLGNGTTIIRRIPYPAILPAGVTSFSAVAAGGSKSCGIGNNGKVYCWGENSNGQLGDGTLTHRSTPLEVTMPAGVTSFSAVGGGWHLSCALR